MLRSIVYAAALCAGGIVAGGTLAVAQEPAPSEGVPVLWEDFDGPEPGPMHERLAADRRMEVVDGAGPDGSAALKVAYVGNEQGSERLVQRFPFGALLEEATLCYDVKFDEDFQFVSGGKMHGLGPVRTTSGGQEKVPDGWTARINFGAEGSTYTYIYSQNKKTKWGDTRRPEQPFNFEKGRYYAVSLHIRINDPGKDNGTAYIYVDGKRIVTHEGIEYRGVGGDRTLIQQLLFSTFHGGNGPKWAPRDENGDYVTVHAWYDNFAVFPGREIRSEPGERPASLQQQTGGAAMSTHLTGS